MLLISAGVTGRRDGRGPRAALSRRPQSYDSRGRFPDSTVMWEAGPCAGLRPGAGAGREGRQR
ncbi:hypothetical protein HMPREF1317_1003, partial [Schaalia georgiae F0490]